MKNTVQPSQEVSRPSDPIQTEIPSAIAGLSGDPKSLARKAIELMIATWPIDKSIAKIYLFVENVVRRST